MARARLSIMSCVWRAPASCSRAKACSRWSTREPLPLPAKAAVALARLIERPTRQGGASRLAAALTRLGPSYVKLGQFLATRARRRRHDDRARSRKPAGPDGAVPAGRGGGRRRRRLRQAAGRGLRELRPGRSPPPRSRRCTAPKSTIDGARKPVAVKILRPGVERRFQRDLDAFFFAARTAESLSPEAQRLRLIEVVETLARSVAMEMDFRLEAAALSEMAENTREDTDFRVPHGRLGPHRARSADARMDRRHAAQRPRRARAPGFDLPALGRT